MHRKLPLTAHFLVTIGLPFFAPLILATPTHKTVRSANSTNLSTIAAEACEYNGCRCNATGGLIMQGQVCGSCRFPGTDNYVISKLRNNSHYYECGPTGGCCDYGFSYVCAKADIDGSGGLCRAI